VGVDRIEGDGIVGHQQPKRPACKTLGFMAARLPGMGGNPDTAEG